MLIRLLLILALAPLAGAAEPPATAHEAEQQWRFRVFLDEREIGHHHFTLRHRGEEQRVTSEAEFEVSLLFLTLYEYRHANEEIWREGCLARLSSETDANGESHQVSGQREGSHFTVRGTGGVARLPACVMSFAYWDPRFLEQDRLLNAQNGEFVEVQVSAPEMVDWNVGGESRPARKYALSAGDLRLKLWYSERGEWLGLEGLAEGGRTLRYVLL